MLRSEVEWDAPTTTSVVRNGQRQEKQIFSLNGDGAASAPLAVGRLVGRLNWPKTSNIENNVVLCHNQDNNDAVVLLHSSNAISRNAFAAGQAWLSTWPLGFRLLAEYADTSVICDFRQNM